MAAVPLLPQSVAFFDARHGLLATAPAACREPHGCTARIETTGDGGRTWVVRLRARGPVALSAVRGTRLAWALTADALLRSEDGGVSWRRVPAAHPGVPQFVSASEGWLSGGGSGGGPPPTVLVTADGGRTWRERTTPCRGPLGFGLAVAPFAPGGAWLVCFGQGGAGNQAKALYLTRDGGRTWTLRQPERRMPSFGYVSALQMLADGHGWLLLARGGLLATADGGGTWRTFAITPPDRVSPVSASLLDDRTGYAVIRGCPVSLVGTTDGGRRWTTLRRFGNPVC